MNKNNMVWIILCTVLLLTNIITFICFSIDNSSIASENSVESIIDNTSIEEQISIDEETSDESSEEEKILIVPISSAYERVLEGDLVIFTKELEYCEAQSEKALELYNELIAFGYSPEEEMMLCLEQDAVVFLEHANYYSQIIQDRYAIRNPSDALEKYPAAT